MNRRDVLKGVASATGTYLTLRYTIACSDDPAPVVKDDEARADVESLDTVDASTSDAGSLGDASDSDADAARTVRLYDTNAVALYFDGGMGPYTGVIKVAYILANTALTLDFWHGHGGVQHRFTLLPEHFAELKQLRRVYLMTSIVDGHQHKMFIDPVNTTYRVRGAVGVDVPV